MVKPDLKTGIRRVELANLETNGINSDFSIVRIGKGGKNR